MYNYENALIIERLNILSLLDADYGDFARSPRRAQPGISKMASLYKGAPTDLTQSIQVIGAGYPRTGTSSFTLALQILLKHPVLHSGSACLTREEGIPTDDHMIAGS